jgi:hypothetical protein
VKKYTASDLDALAKKHAATLGPLVAWQLLVYQNPHNPPAIRIEYIRPDGKRWDQSVPLT